MDTENIIPGSGPNEPFSTVSPAVQNESPAHQDRNRRAGLVNQLRRLFFRPGKFFAEDARLTPAFGVALCAYVSGAAWSLIYYTDTARRAELPKDMAAAYVFGATLVAAMVGGAFWYFVAGTWYGMRVSLCRPQGLTWKLSRRAFIFSELVYALPCAIGMSIWWVTQHRSVLLGTMIVTAGLMFWSVYVSYCAVRTLFQAGRFRAVVLFIALPSLLYAACLAGPILLRNARSNLTKGSVFFEDSVLTMDRPVNWVPLKNPRAGVVQFHIPDVRSFVVNVQDFQDTEVDVQEVTQAWAQRAATKFKSVAKELDTFSAWGCYSGYGLCVSVNVDGNETIARFFCAPLPDGRVLMVNESSLARAEPELRAQFEVARKTLKVKPTGSGR